MSEWQKRTLNELGDFMSGGGFPIIYQGETSGDYPFYKVSDLNNIGNESCLDRSNNYIHEDVRRKLGLKLIPQNSIVFAKIGAAVYLERKRIMIHNGLIDNNMAAFIGNGTTIEKLMYYIFQLIRIGNYTNTTALPAVDLRGLGHHEAYYPVDPKEQSRIAAVLTAADEAIAASRALVEKYAAVKQGLMRDLLTGNGSLNRFSEIADPISRKGNANGRICINMDCVESGTGELLPIVDAENSSAKTEFVAGDVLFGKLRPYLRKYWLATFDGVCSSELMVFRAKPNIRRQYLYYIVSSNAFIEYNNSQTYGTKMPRTSWSIIKQYKTNVPNISEQDRVIEVLSAADERLATERKRLMKLEYIKRGLMDDLLTNRVSTDKLQGGI